MAICKNTKNGPTPHHFQSLCVQCTIKQEFYICFFLCISLFFTTSFLFISIDLKPKRIGCYYSVVHGDGGIITPHRFLFGFLQMKPNKWEKGPILVKLLHAHGFWWGFFFSFHQLPISFLLHSPQKFISDKTPLKLKRCVKFHTICSLDLVFAR